MEKRFPGCLVSPALCTVLNLGTTFKKKKTSWRASNLRWSIINEMTSKMIRHHGKTAAGQLGHLSAGFHLRLHNGYVSEGRSQNAKTRKRHEYFIFLSHFFPPPEKKRQ